MAPLQPPGLELDVTALINARDACESAHACDKFDISPVDLTERPHLRFVTEKGTPV